MKHLIRYIYVLCVCTAPMVTAQEIPVTGTWEIDDFEYDLEVNCACTEAQKKAITKGIKSSVREEFDYIAFDTYFEFDDNNKVEGILIEDEFETTYEQDGDMVTIFFEENNIHLKLIPEEYERLMIFEFNEQQLENSHRSFEMDEVGEVDFKYTQVQFIFKNLFDDAYDDFIDERDFGED